MSDTTSLALAALAGVVLGVIFFGGLWWTVGRAVASPQPFLWFSGSLLLRTGIALGGLYLVGGGRWERLVMCLLGFVAARAIVTWLSRRVDAQKHVAARGGGHAP